jgi:hypothetical protein
MPIALSPPCVSTLKTRVAAYLSGSRVLIEPVSELALTLSALVLGLAFTFMFAFVLALAFVFAFFGG